MSERRVVVVGGGAAGFFGAVTCAEALAGGQVTVLEQSAQFLSKVRISGGGRCNVTHACFEPRELASRYPRGGKALLGPFQQFQPRDTIEWFETRGVKLKTEADGRMFPTSDSSQTIIDCLMGAAQKAGVLLRANQGVTRVKRQSDGTFELRLSQGERIQCEGLLLATGGCRGAGAGELAVSLGHTLEAPVPSLFGFDIATPWLRALAGVSVPEVVVGVEGFKRREQGPLLLTHRGVSGPAVLRLSAWAARELHQRNYEFKLLLNWLPQLEAGALEAALQSRRQSQPAKLIVNTPVAPLSARLWEQLVMASGIERATRWAELSGAGRHRLQEQLSRSQLPVQGRSLNRDEFVTCGGVPLGELNFKSMESRLCPGLFMAGELLDIDGITGGFNFQAAWTTGWLAGRGLGAGG